MKKIYTIPVLLLSLSSYAQLEEVQEEASSQPGYVLQQKGSTIDVEKEQAIMNQQQILLAENSGGKVDNPTNPTIFKTTDANGNELWVLSNGVVVRNVTQEPNYGKEPMSILRSKEGIKVEKVAISKPSEEIIETTTVEGNTSTISTLEEQQENLTAGKSSTNVTISGEDTTNQLGNVEISTSSITESDTTTSQPGDITITADDLKGQDLSDLFSPDVNSMSAKDRKQYEKNQKKIKKQLDRDLKKENNRK